MSPTTLLTIMKYVSRPKSAAVKDINIDIADILGQKYRYCIDIGKGDIDPPPLRISITKILRDVNYSHYRWEQRCWETYLNCKPKLQLVKKQPTTNRHSQHFSHFYLHVMWTNIAHRRFSGSGADPVCRLMSLGQASKMADVQHIHHINKLK